MYNAVTFCFLLIVILCMSGLLAFLTLVTYPILSIVCAVIWVLCLVGFIAIARSRDNRA